MRSHLRTPLIVDVDKTPIEYIKGLTKAARKNYRAAMSNHYQFTRVQFDYPAVMEWMDLWSGQIGGNWAFGPEYFTGMDERGWLEIFVGHRGSTTLACLPMEHFDGFMYAQPVMYNKKTDPNLAKFMWFSMLEWACSNKYMKAVDLGGGFNGSWDQFIQTRGGPTFKYKWRFVAKDVKENPDSQRPWFVQRCQCGWKFLTLAPQPCPNCGDVPCRMYG